jgi:hypothetical protein
MTRLGAFHDATLADRGWGPACPDGLATMSVRVLAGRPGLGLLSA